MGRKIIVMLLVAMATAVLGITYGSMVLNSQTTPSSTSATICKPEHLSGNFTTTPEMNEASTGPYSLTFYVQNLSPQSATITEYTDNNGLIQRVNWTVGATTTGSFQSTINQTEDSLTLQTSCGTLFTTHLYYPAPSGSHTNHYNVTLSVSLGGNAT